MTWTDSHDRMPPLSSLPSTQFDTCTPTQLYATEEKALRVILRSILTSISQVLMLVKIANMPNQRSTTESLVTDCEVGRQKVPDM